MAHGLDFRSKVGDTPTGCLHIRRGRIVVDELLIVLQRPTGDELLLLVNGTDHLAANNKKDEGSNDSSGNEEISFVEDGRRKMEG